MERRLPNRRFPYPHGNIRRPLAWPLHGEGSGGCRRQLEKPRFRFGRRGTRASHFLDSTYRQNKGVQRSSHDRLFDVTQVPGSPEFLEAGFLVAQGTKQSLILHEPEGLLILHRTRLDAEGRLALTRLDETLATRWSTILPIIELGNRFELPDRLLMYGALQLTERGVTGWQEFVVAVDLRDGRARAWNVTLEQSAATALLEKAAQH